VKKVAFFVFNTAQGDLRVHRQARLLVENGYEVRIYCFLEPGLPHREERSGYTIVREDQRSPLTRFFDDQIVRRLRGQRKSVAPQVSERLPVLPPDQPPQRPCPAPPVRQLPSHFLEGEEDYLQYVRVINRVWAREATAWKPDVCQAHDLDALEAAAATAEACSAALIYDSHELWTDQPFIRSQPTVDYWNALEARYVPRCQAIFTVNQPFARVLEEKYGVAVRTLHNCQDYRPLPRPSQELRQRAQGRPVALYQGVLGLDRGLEQLVASAQYQQEVVVALRGYGALESTLAQLVEGQENVWLLPACKPEEIIERAAEADLGVIPFLPTCLNHYLNTPNKLFEYMLAGLPIAAADLPDLRRFVEGEKLGLLFDPFSPSDIARALVELAANPDRQECGLRGHEACRLRYNWEQEGRTLLECYTMLTR